ncbi:MAG: SDR family oxidoreductase [Streptosporangiaceae bacterium]
MGRPQVSSRPGCGVLHEQGISPWPDGRQTTVENSADMVAMLCLDEASWIAGQTITVDGGYRRTAAACWSARARRP